MDEQMREFSLAHITMNEVLYRQVAPLLPAVFYDHEQTVIPDRYSMLTPDQADEFTIDDLQGVSVYEIQHHTLDIVGVRMRNNPEAVLSLAGRISSEEADEHRMPRAVAFRDYLMTVWKIDSSRIKIVDKSYWMEPSNEATEDGRADNRRVEFHSNVAAIMAPVITERVSVSFDPPYLKMVPTIDAEAGVRSWRINVTQAGTVLGRYSSDQSGGIDNSDLSWKIDHDGFDDKLSPVVAELEVIDSVGSRVEAIDELPLQMKHQVKVVDGRIIRIGNQEHISYTLVGFDFDLAELTWQNKQAIEEIARLTRTGATVRVIGYTDRIGDPERNDRLSIDRANNTARALRKALKEIGVKNVSIDARGEGVETERFTNDFPEGRVLSRGVSIFVDQTAGE
jgi:outer membrane protein OmpA-like peptidoglycan-associated protein